MFARLAGARGGSKRMSRLAAALSVVLSGAVALASLGGQPAGAEVPFFAGAFAGQPASPAAWQPADWDITVHSRDRETWAALEPMAAHHGSDCGAPPTTHTTTRYEDSVFICKDHLMTALNATGYGMVYLTPNQLLSMAPETGGVAKIQFDLSTQRASLRDWVDLWITPYDQNLQLPLDEWIPDGNGLPKNAIHVRLDNFVPEKGTVQSIWKAAVVRDFKSEDVAGNTWTGYESFLEPSATRRETYELQISRTHIKFGLPKYNFWWVDADIKDLGWDQAVIQLGHHSYNPKKDCEIGLLVRHKAHHCGPNTWHWNNVRVSPAKPFTVLRSDQRGVGPGVGQADAPAELRFARPAPAASHLRFAAIGRDIQISTDGGTTWRAAQEPGQSKANVEDHFQGYWTAIPAGTQRVLVKGTAWYGAPWTVRDASVWSREVGVEVAGVQLRPARPFSGLRTVLGNVWELISGTARRQIGALRYGS